MSITCPDCKGTGEYVGAFVREVCQRCNGLKVIGPGAARDAKSKALDDMFEANKLPDWMKDHKGSLLDLEGLGRDKPPGYDPDVDDLSKEEVDQMVKDIINDLHNDPDSGWSKDDDDIPLGYDGSNVQAPDSIQVTTFAPKISIGDTIYVYDCGWYEPTVAAIYQDSNGRSMIRADYACGTFRISITELNYNLTKRRWECIKAGTPTP